MLFGKALVLVEHNNSKVFSVPYESVFFEFSLQVSPASLSAITAASKFGDVTALVAGKGCGAVAEAASKVNGLLLFYYFIVLFKSISGVKIVVQVDSAEYANLLPENMATLVQVCGAISQIFLLHSVF